MMSTTSLKIPSEVKDLAIAAARQQGVTPHAFMVNAIRVVASAAEQRAQFVADAIDARAEALESGKGYPADEVGAYLLRRAEGKSSARPKAKNWRG